MKNLKWVFWGYLLLLSGLWWLTDATDFSSLAGVFAWRQVLTQYTGLLGMGVMSLAMILALRPLALEARLGGLDKMYRLHKWLGIAGLALSVSHWLVVKGPKWLVELGVLTRGPRPPRVPLPEGSLEALFGHFHGLAEDVGEWAFYGAVVLMVLALLKAFPYRRFVQTHKFLAVAYLALVFHAVILVRFEYWRGPLVLALVPLLALGSVAAVQVLLRRRAGARPVSGRIESLEVRGSGPAQTVSVAVQVDGEAGWPGHAAGQFALVTFHGEEGAHPFTLASSWQGDGRVRFVIKALGDYTRTLGERLKVGDPVRLEGPYGCFTFQGQGPQVWIAGGIGVTPFMARLESLATGPAAPGAPTVAENGVDFFHATADYDEALINRLGHQADRAGVNYHLLWNQRDGRLDVARLTTQVPRWREADFWFCGPAAFGASLRQGLVALGLPPERFHQELFEMR